MQIHSVDKTFDDDVTQEELMNCIHELNEDPLVHGILVQLPLPKHIDEAAVLRAIKVAKDADGFSAQNIGVVIDCRSGSSEVLMVSICFGQAIWF